jgi:16S rRNA G966 N2-methylase RsmD
VGVFKSPLPEILWCTSNKRAGVDGWSFPRQVEETILKECAGMSFVHLFGGKANFGVRLDVDTAVRPDVVGDAWRPPFARNSFDCVILDPPYVGEFRAMGNDRLRCLFRAAAWIARKRVIWFHTVWVESPARCVRGKTWLVRVGRHCQIRTLQFFEVSEERKLPPVERFNSGPAMKYNRWLIQPQGLPFGPLR